MERPFLTVDQVVERYGGAWSAKTIRNHASQLKLPHRIFPARRGLLFPLAELERYEAGEVELEVINLPGGGRIWRPCG